jgi:hypothetical protein
MFRKSVAIGFICSSLAFAASNASAQNATQSGAKLTAAAIADKNAAARGGLQAWRNVQTISYMGRMGAGGNRRATLPVALPDKKADPTALPQRPAEEAQLPFVMEMMRPNKMRVEVQFKGQTSVQVYDGANGWKLRPYLNRRVVEPYTADEMKLASTQPEIDGPLVDYAAKGTKVGLDGTENVEGRDTYKLKLTEKNGHEIRVWVDSQTFLEAKIEGQPRRLDGTDHPVEIYYRDYRDVNGLQIPFTLETRVLPVAKTAIGFRDTPVPPEKINIEKVTVNPKLDDSHFSKPDVAMASNAH